MNILSVYAAAGILLFFIGLYALLFRRQLLSKILAANIMGSGVFLVFIGLAEKPAQSTDPVPQAMVLTGIIVTLCFTAAAIALAVRLKELNEEHRSATRPEDDFG